MWLISKEMIRTNSQSSKSSVSNADTHSQKTIQHLTKFLRETHATVGPPRDFSRTVSAIQFLNFSLASLESFTEPLPTKLANSASTVLVAAQTYLHTLEESCLRASDQKIRACADDSKRYQQWTQPLRRYSTLMLNQQSVHHRNDIHRTRHQSAPTLEQQLDAFRQIADQLHAIPPTWSRMTYWPYAAFWALSTQAHTAWLDQLAQDRKRIHELRPLLDRQAMLQTFLTLPLDAKTVEPCARMLIGKYKETIAPYRIVALRLWLETSSKLANTLARLPDAVDYETWQALYNQIRNLIQIWPPSPVRLSLADCYSETVSLVFRWFNDGRQSFAEALMQRLCALDPQGTYLDRAMQRSFTPQSWDLLAAEHLRTRLHFPAKHRLLHRPTTPGDSGTSGLPTQSGFAAWIAHVQQHSAYLTLAQRIQLLELTERATQNIITSPARFPDGWYTVITEEPFRSWGWQLISIGPADYQWGRVRIDSEHGSFVFTMGAKTVNDTLSDVALLAVTWLLAWLDGAGQSPTFGSNRRSERRTHSFQPSSPTRDRFAPTPLKRVLGRSFSRPRLQSRTTRSDPTGRAVVSHPVCSYFRWVRSDFVASPQRQALAAAASVTIPPGYTFVPASWSPRMDQHIESQPVSITPQWTRHTTMYAWRVAVAQWQA